MPLPRGKANQSPRLSVAAFEALRELGPALFPPASVPCSELAPLPKELERLPLLVQRAISNGVRQAFRQMPPVHVQPAPYVTAPFRSSPFRATFPVFVGSSDVAAQAAATQLLNAWTGQQILGGGFSPVNPPGTTTPLEFWSYQTSAYERVHLSAVEIIPSSLDAYKSLYFLVRVGEQTFVDQFGTVDNSTFTLGNPRGVGILGLRELSVEVPPNEKLSLLVGNRDTLSAFALDVIVKGWRYPCTGMGDELCDTIQREDGCFEPSDPCAELEQE